MAKLRAHNIMISVDGYTAGPNQSLDNPLGERGFELHKRRFAKPGEIPSLARAGADPDIEKERWDLHFDGIGATIMGRNMYGPIRGEWSDDEWKGWWGDDPPYHGPVFVLTHFTHESIPMEGGTTFHFVTDGIESALEKAFAAANGKDVSIGGGASTIQQYLRAQLIDDLYLVIAPEILGAGERLFDNLDGGPKGYEIAEHASSPNHLHVHLTRITK